LFQLTDFLLIITADLLLLWYWNSVDNSLAHVRFLGNAHLAVDHTGSVVTLGILGTFTVILGLFNSTISCSTSSRSGTRVSAISVAVVIAVEFCSGAASLVVQGLIDVGTNRVDNLDALEIVLVHGIGLVHCIAHAL
jgi:hypothetical protein